VLFSSAEVAKRINDTFEPAWETVRPVPTVTIDFGNGEKITRTLHGNIATYVCTADGKVLDILPGIYEPKVYTQRLMGIATLHQMTKSERPERVTEVTRSYHTMRVDMLKAGGKRGSVPLDMGKAVVESPLKMLARMQSVALPPAVPTNTGERHGSTAAEIAGWKELADDTRINETNRRLQIHTYLGQHGLVTPNDMVKWLYKEVLHADLDDPYLGLGEVLFKDYPFAREDARR